MTELPTYRGSRVVAHTVPHPTRRVFEHDGSNCLPWHDMDRQNYQYPQVLASAELQDPAPVPLNPWTGEYLHPVPTDATIPAGATYYRKASNGVFGGPFDADVAYTPTMRDARATYWTVDPLPEPEKAVPARVDWWDVLTDDQRAAYASLGPEQAGGLTELLPHTRLGDTRIADEGLTPVLHDLTSDERGDVQDAIADLIEAWLTGDLG